MKRRRTAWFAIAFAQVACGGAPPPPPAPPPAPLPAPVAAAPDLSEVAEPKRLVGIMRWKSPSATLGTIKEWTGVGIDAAQLATEAIDKSLASALAFDAPIDAAVALDERSGDSLTPSVAFSVGVRSLDGARDAAKELGTVSEIGPGEYKVNLRHGKRKKDKPYCVLSAAVGPTPGRFVCGEHERDVEALRGYMTRTLPKRDFGPSDVHVEFHMAPVVDFYGDAIRQGLHMGAALLPRKLQIGEPVFDRAIDRLAAGLSDEIGAVVQDLDLLTWDLSMAPDQASSTFSIRMKGQQSWTTGTFASAASRAGAAPPMYWHLPASSTGAFYEHVPEARRFEAIRHTAGELVDGWLQHEGIAPADRGAIVALFADKFMIDTPVVAAIGAFPSAAPAKASKTPDKPGKDTGKNKTAIDPLQAALVKSGWLLVGIGAPNQAGDFVKTLAAASSRPKIQAAVKDQLASLAPKDETRDKWITGLALKPAPAPKELPKGSLAFELAIAHDAPSDASAGAPAPRKPKAQPAPAKVYVYVVTESAQTWIALGADKTELAKIVLSALEGAPESAMLGSRQDVAAFRQSKLAVGGFWTLEAMMHSLLAPASWADGEVAQSTQNADALLATTPGKGKTPITTTEEITTGDGTKITVRTVVPKAVIEDVVLLAAGSGLARRLPRP